jgi:predicted AlkP superfamily phosphohydrolase/phosphomutase
MRDFGRRRFWLVPSDLVHTPIRCNVVGREPYGRVAPGAELDALCSRLRREFLALVEPGTGRRLVEDVIVTADRYPGAGPGDFADLLVVWDRTQPLLAATSPTVGEVRAEPSPTRLGEHRDGGFVLARGPGIPPTGPADPIAIVDFAPTVTRLLDVPFAADGRAVPGVVPRPSGDGQAAVVSMLNDDHRSA